MARNPTNPAATTNTASAEDEVLIREIDEAVRQDDAIEFLRKYGVALLAGIGVLIAGLAGWMLWDNYSEGQLEEQSEALISALDYADQGDFKTASERAAELAADSSPGARTAAGFLQAGAALEEGNLEKAIGFYKAIAADEGAPSAMRDLARIREVAAGFDTMKPADAIARLKDLAVPGNPYFASAGELVAMAHLEAGNRAEAGRLFAAIAKDEDAPESLRSRARQMAGLLGVDAIVDVKKLLEDQGVVASEGAGGDNGENAAPAR